jgi:diguanylate cyclase (GGDEF)-like protein
LVAEYFEDHTASRFGGEEFCVYFSNIPPKQVEELMQSFRLAMENKSLTFEKKLISCTVSIGLTHQTKGGINNMLRLADQHLYHAKHNGRNQLVSDQVNAD